MTAEAQRAFGVPQIPLPLIIPVDEPDAFEEADEAAADEQLENALQPELPKEDPEPASVTRQSSIFKLLSPDIPSYGTSAPPNLSNPSPDAYPTASQNTQDEVEAML